MIPDVLHTAVQQLPEPSSYYEGVTALPIALPQNILLFARNTLPPGHERNTQHHRYVLIINLETPGQLCLDEQVLDFPVGSAVLVFPYQLHHYLTIGVPVTWLFVTFEMSGADTVAGLRDRAVPVGDSAWHLVEDILQSFRARPEDDGPPRLTYALLLLLLTLQSESPCPRSRGETGLGEQTVSIIEHVNRHVYAHLDQPLTNGDVASAVGMSVSHLRASFRRAMGVSLGHYVRQVRINRAMALLRRTERSVTEIADACGFSSLYSFSRTFKQAAGRSPQAFRRSEIELSGQRQPDR